MLIKNDKNPQASTIQLSSQESKLEEESFRDIFILLCNLLEREEKTILMIIDCLYEIGSVNLINKKVRSRQLNSLLKLIRRAPKPIFRIIALRLVKKKSPAAITNWLFKKVKF
jgi:hypothetical protein